MIQRSDFFKRIAEAEIKKRIPTYFDIDIVSKRLHMKRDEISKYVHYFIDQGLMMSDPEEDGYFIITWAGSQTPIYKLLRLQLVIMRHDTYVVCPNCGAENLATLKDLRKKFFCKKCNYNLTLSPDREKAFMSQGLPLLFVYENPVNLYDEDACNAYNKYIAKHYFSGKGPLIYAPGIDSQYPHM